MARFPLVVLIALFVAISATVLLRAPEHESELADPVFSCFRAVVDFPPGTAPMGYSEMTLFSVCPPVT